MSEKDYRVFTIDKKKEYSFSDKMTLKNAKKTTRMYKKFYDEKLVSIWIEKCVKVDLQ